LTNCNVTSANIPNTDTSKPSSSTTDLKIETKYFENSDDTCQHTFENDNNKGYWSGHFTLALKSNPLFSKYWTLNSANYAWMTNTITDASSKCTEMTYT